MFLKLIIYILGTASLLAADPKVGDHRADVLKALGEPNAISPLREGGAIFSYPRGDIYFDSKEVVKVDMISEEELRIKNEKRAAALPGIQRSEEYRRLAGRIRSLGARFRIDEDDITKDLHFTPEYFFAARDQSPTIWVTVDAFESSQLLSITTIYRGGEWIFHDRFSIRVGSNSYSSSQAKLSSGDIKRKAMLGNGVIEICHYPDTDNVIAKAIASDTGLKVLLRLEGGEGRTEVELTKEHKAAIRDAVELSDVLARVFKMRREDGIKGRLNDVK